MEMAFFLKVGAEASDVVMSVMIKIVKELSVV
jgi:hypothetical protein